MTRRVQGKQQTARHCTQRLALLGWRPRSPRTPRSSSTGRTLASRQARRLASPCSTPLPLTVVARMALRIPTSTTLMTRTYVRVTMRAKRPVVCKTRTTTRICGWTRMKARGLSTITERFIPSQCLSLPHRIAQKAQNHKEAGWPIWRPP